MNTARKPHVRLLAVQGNLDKHPERTASKQDACYVANNGDSAVPGKRLLDNRGLEDFMKNEIYETSSSKTLITVIVISAIMILILGSVSMYLMISVSNVGEISNCISKIVACGFVFSGIIIFSTLALIAANLLIRTEKFSIKITSTKDAINKYIDEEYLKFLKDMELRDLVKEGLTSQRDLIKKYCDTLLEL